MEYERNMNNKPAVLETLFCALATLLNLSVRRDIQVGALVCCAAIQLKLHVSRDIQLDAVLSVGQGGCKLNMLMSAKRHLAAASSRVCLAPRSRCRSTPTCHSSRQATTAVCTGGIYVVLWGIGLPDGQCAEQLGEDMQQRFIPQLRWQQALAMRRWQQRLRMWQRGMWARLPCRPLMLLCSCCKYS